jgi:hypothetical protein
MIVNSINIRGLGERVKRCKLKELVNKEKIDFLAIQETKLEIVYDVLCFSIWGYDDCSWAYLPSVGNSGEILSIWRKSSSRFVYSFCGEGFVGVYLEWGVHKKICFMVNVYYKCDMEGKRWLWNALIMSKGGFSRGAWCVRDFNAVLHKEEMRGVNDNFFINNPLDLSEFQAFVNYMELEDIPVLGRKFTWFHPNRRAMSRIDRVLLSDEWLFSWGDPSL